MSNTHFTRSQAAQGNPTDASSDASAVADDTASLSGNDALLRALSRLETKFDGLKSNFDGVRSDLDDIKTEFTEFRGRLDSLESRSRGPSSPVAQTFTVPPPAATATKEAEADTTYRDPDNFHTVTRKFTVFSPDAPPPAKPRPPVNEHIQLTKMTAEFDYFLSS